MIFRKCYHAKTRIIVRQSDLLGDIVIGRRDNSAVAALEAAEVGADYP